MLKKGKDLEVRPYSILNQGKDCFRKVNIFVVGHFDTKEGDPVYPRRVTGVRTQTE